jgi:hypothetical protein
MPIPAAVLAAAVRALPYIVSGAKTAGPWVAKHPWGLLGAGWMGLNEVGQMGERGLMKEQLRLQEEMGKSSAEAAKKGTKESRRMAEKYLQILTQAKRDEAREERESLLMQSYMESQNRQVAMLLQAMQGLTATAPQTGVNPSAGMTALLRSNL